jgi:Protein of unknown function (DUF3572)
MARVNRIDTRAAEQLAIQALGYLAGEPEQLGRFLALTGLGPETIRTAAHDPRFLAGVLDYIAGHEALLTAFAAHAEVKPARVMEARAALGSQDWERETP